MNEGMHADHSQFDRIHNLAMAALANELTEADARELERLVVEDPSARRAYVLYMSATFDLRDWADSSAAEAPPADESGESSSRSEMAPQQGVAPRTTGAAQFPSLPPSKPVSDAGAGNEPLAARQVPILGRLPFWLGWINRPTALGVLLAVFVAALAAWQLRKPGEAPPSAAPPLVAFLIPAADAQWTAVPPMDGFHGRDVAAPAKQIALQAGQRVILSRGTAEIRFSSGAEAMLHGPAELTVAPGVELAAHAANSCYLAAGRLTAHVPATAHGFTVRSALTNVVDLGTRFDMNVAGDGTSVRVDEGRVRVDPIANAGGSTSAPPAGSERWQPVLLQTGDSVRIDAASRRLVRTSPAAYEQFVLGLQPMVYLPLEAEPRPDRKPSDLSIQTTIRNLANPQAPATLSTPELKSRFVGGRVGQSLQFGGAGRRDYVTVETQKSRVDEFTFAAWVWLDSAAPTTRYIASHWWAGHRVGFGLGVDERGELFAIAPHRVQRVRYDMVEIKETDEAFPVASWQHVAVVADTKAGTLVLYRNGKPRAAKSSFGIYLPDVMVLNQLMIGYSPEDVKDPHLKGGWTGRIDEVLVLSRALSSEEIGRLFSDSPAQ